MPYVKITKRHHVKVMKTILSLKKPFNNRITVDKSFYDLCGLSTRVVEESLNALAAADFIELIPSSPNAYPTIEIKQSAYTYFPNIRSEAIKFWIPIICTNVIAIAALVVAILAYIKQ